MTASKSKQRGLITVGVALSLYAFAATAAAAAQPDYRARAVAGDPSGANWLLNGRTYSDQHYSPLAQIDSANVRTLGKLWSVDIPTKDGLSATPVVVDGVAYISTSLSVVYAMDGATGKILWSFDPKTKLGLSVANSWTARSNRGVGVWGGKVFVGTADCRLIAIDAATGKLVWQTQTCDSTQEQGIDGPPLVANGKVYIGNGVSDFGNARGYLAAFNASDGKEVWRFYTVPDGKQPESRALQIASKTWATGRSKNGGAAVWGAIDYDPELNSIYFGTDGSTPLNAEVRSPGDGDCLFTNSIVAVDADTGEYKWHYQVVPRDTWDYNATMPLMAADLVIGSTKRKVLMQAPKNGFFFVIDRETGKFISADKYAPVSWASHYDPNTGRPVENPGARYYKNADGRAVVSPGTWGAHNWQAMSMNPATGLVYFSTWDIPATYTYNPKAGIADVSIEFYTAGTDAASIRGRGSLIAWDPVRGEVRWKVPQAVPINGGTLATAGNLVFHGTGTGLLNAYTADDGQRLWSWKTGSTIQAAPITYSIAGKQIILAAVGAPAIVRNTLPAYGARTGARGPSRLIAFALGAPQEQDAEGTASVAAPIATPPDLKATPEIVANGANLFSGNGCMLCHGAQADTIGGSVPDLRRSPILQSKEAWYQVVVNGAKRFGGMMPFEGLTEAEAEALRAYVAVQAWQEYNSIHH